MITATFFKGNTSILFFSESHDAIRNNLSEFTYNSILFFTKIQVYRTCLNDFYIYIYTIEHIAFFLVKSNSMLGFNALKEDI